MKILLLLYYFHAVWGRYDDDTITGENVEISPVVSKVTNTKRKIIPQVTYDKVVRTHTEVVPEVTYKRVPFVKYDVVPHVELQDVPTTSVDVVPVVVFRRVLRRGTKKVPKVVNRRVKTAGLRTVAEVKNRTITRVDTRHVPKVNYVRITENAPEERIRYIIKANKNKHRISDLDSSFNQQPPTRPRVSVNPPSRITNFPPFTNFNSASPARFSSIQQPPQGWSTFRRRRPPPLSRPSTFGARPRRPSRIQNFPPSFTGSKQRIGSQSIPNSRNVVDVLRPGFSPLPVVSPPRRPVAGVSVSNLVPLNRRRPLQQTQFASVNPVFSFAGPPGPQRVRVSNSVPLGTGRPLPLPGTPVNSGDSISSIPGINHPRRPVTGIRTSNFVRLGPGRPFPLPETPVVNVNSISSIPGINRPSPPRHPVTGVRASNSIPLGPGRPLPLRETPVVNVNSISSIPGIIRPTPPRHPVTGVRTSNSIPLGPGRPLPLNEIPLVNVNSISSIPGIIRPTPLRHPVTGVRTSNSIPLGPGRPLPLPEIPVVNVNSISSIPGFNRPGPLRHPETRIQVSDTIPETRGRPLPLLETPVVRVNSRLPPPASVTTFVSVNNKQPNGPIRVIRPIQPTREIIAPSLPVINSAQIITRVNQNPASFNVLQNSRSPGRLAQTIPIVSSTNPQVGFRVTQNVNSVSLNSNSRTPLRIPQSASVNNLPPATFTPQELNALPISAESLSAAALLSKTSPPSQNFPVNYIPNLPLGSIENLPTVSQNTRTGSVSFSAAPEVTVNSISPLIAVQGVSATPSNPAQNRDAILQGPTHSSVLPNSQKVLPSKPEILHGFVPMNNPTSRKVEESVLTDDQLSLNHPNLQQNSGIPLSSNEEPGIREALETPLNSEENLSFSSAEQQQPIPSDISPTANTPSEIPPLPDFSIDIESEDALPPGFPFEGLSFSLEDPELFSKLGVPFSNSNDSEVQTSAPLTAEDLSRIINSGALGRQQTSNPLHTDFSPIPRSVNIDDIESFNTDNNTFPAQNTETTIPGLQSSGKKPKSIHFEDSVNRTAEEDLPLNNEKVKATEPKSLKELAAMGKVFELDAGTFHIKQDSANRTVDDFTLSNKGITVAEQRSLDTLVATARFLEHQNASIHLDEDLAKEEKAPDDFDVNTPSSGDVSPRSFASLSGGINDPQSTAQEWERLRPAK